MYLGHSDMTLRIVELRRSKERWLETCTCMGSHSGHGQTVIMFNGLRKSVEVVAWRTEPSLIRDGCWSLKEQCHTHVNCNHAAGAWSPDNPMEHNLR